MKFKHLGIHFIDNESLKIDFLNKREFLKSGFEFSFFSQIRNLDDPMNLYPFWHQNDFLDLNKFYESCFLSLNKKTIIFSEDIFDVFTEDASFEFSGSDLINLNFNLLSFGDGKISDEFFAKSLLLKIDKNNDFKECYKQLEDFTKKIKLIKLKKESENHLLVIETLDSKNFNKLIDECFQILIKNIKFYYEKISLTDIELIEIHLKKLYLEKIIFQDDYLKLNHIFNNFKNYDSINIFNLIFEMNELRLFDEIHFKIKEV